MILQLSPHEYAVLAWVRDDGGEPVYRIAQRGIKAAKIAGTLARKLMKQQARP